MNEQEKIFADEYLRTYNVSASVRKAGFEGKNMTRIGNSLLEKKEIADYISRSLKKYSTICGRSEIMEVLTGIVRGLPEKRFFIVDGRLIEREVKPRTETVLKACETMAKIYNMFNIKDEDEIYEFTD